MAQKTLIRVKENRSFLKINFKSETAVDANICITQIKSTKSLNTFAFAFVTVLPINFCSMIYGQYFQFCVLSKALSSSKFRSCPSPRLTSRRAGLLRADLAQRDEENKIDKDIPLCSFEGDFREKTFFCCKNFTLILIV